MDSGHAMGIREWKMEQGRPEVISAVGGKPEVEGGRVERVKESQRDRQANRGREAARTKTEPFRNRENMTMTEKHTEPGREGPQTKGPQEHTCSWTPPPAPSRKIQLCLFLLTGTRPH